MEQVLKKLITPKGVGSEYDISIEVQEKLRAENAFCPHLRVGRKIYYFRVEFERWLEEQKAKAASAPAGAPPEALTLGDDSLAATLAEIIKTTPLGDETRRKISELLGVDESGERLWNAGGPDEAA